ncbi:MAG: S-layer homology domain-containing protein [Synergistaceae bacterium]|nr:S-layer homology domain-containing protein [Synergistaceae bacterium]
MNRERKRIIIMMMVMVMIMSASAAAFAAGASFKDMASNHWANSNVSQMVEKKIVAGYPDGTFRPENKVTYAEFIKMTVVGLTGEVLETAKAPDHWAKNYYEKAVDLKLFTTIQIPEKVLDVSIIRADMSLISANAVSGTVPASDSAVIEGYVSDMYKATNRKSSVIKAYYLGILGGYPDQTFRADQGLTRAESAAVIDRIITPSSRLKVDIASMKSVAVPVFPDGSTVAEKDLITTITRLDTLRIDHQSEVFAKYKNGGIYDMQQRGNTLFAISYDTGWNIDGTLAAVDRQKAKMKFILQHYLGNDWDDCYDDILSEVDRFAGTTKQFDIVNNYYNGYEVTINAGSTGAAVTIWKTRTL